MAGTLEVRIVGDAELVKLRSAIEEALSVLGTGDCPVPNCEGCRYERSEATRILIEAIR